VTDRLAEQMTLTNVTVKEGSRGRYHIFGEAANNCKAELSAILGVTFYDADGTVMGKASGSVNRIASGRTKEFWLRISNNVSGYVTMKVRVDCILEWLPVGTATQGLRLRPGPAVRGHGPPSPWRWTQKFLLAGYQTDQATALFW
jgi:hypothetical protein